MNKVFVNALLLLSILYSSDIKAQNYLPQFADNRIKVKNVTPIKAFAFDLSEVSLLESTFKTAMRADEAYLKIIEPDRLLSGFRKNAGLAPKAEMYGGWESDGLAGHTLGHYLSAISMQYASSKDPVFLQKAN